MKYCLQHTTVFSLSLSFLKRKIESKRALTQPVALLFISCIIGRDNTPTYFQMYPLKHYILCALPYRISMSIGITWSKKYVCKYHTKSARRQERRKRAVCFQRNVCEQVEGETDRISLKLSCITHQSCIKTWVFSPHTKETLLHIHVHSFTNTNIYAVYIIKEAAFLPVTIKCTKETALEARTNFFYMYSEQNEGIYSV